MGFNLKQTDNEKGTVVLLHGYGADGNDLKFLAEKWAPLFEDWNFIGPDGHTKMEVGYSWFDLEGYKWEKGIIRATDKLEEHFKNYKKPLIFVGFSQGGFLASQLAAYSNLNTLGSIALSAGLIPLHQTPNKTKLYFIHGKEDDIIDIQWFKEIVELTHEGEFDIEEKLIDGLDHSINKEVVEVATSYLNQLINGQKGFQ